MKSISYLLPTLLCLFFTPISEVKACEATVETVQEPNTEIAIAAYGRIPDNTRNPSLAFQVNYDGLMNDVTTLVNPQLPWGELIDKCEKELERLCRGAAEGEKWIRTFVKEEPYNDPEQLQTKLKEISNALASPSREVLDVVATKFRFVVRCQIIETTFGTTSRQE